MKWKWNTILISATAALLLASEARTLMPASHWFVPGELAVENTVKGTCPGMHFTRAIKRPFHGRWLVTLHRQGPTGGWNVASPPWHGEGDYRPDAELPEPLTMQWWTWDEYLTCDWSPGIYRLLTEWMIQPGGLVRYVRVTSNAFRVRP